MHKQRCVDQQTPPNMERRDLVASGQFFRNLKKEHIAKRYPQDDNNEPQYGFKLHKKHWRYAERQPGPLSVNLQTCIHSAVCSIALHPGGDEYYHVALIDLGALNRLQYLSSPLVAQYQPEALNQCHFVVMPRDGTVLKWMEVAELLDRPFPPAKKLPGTKEEKAVAKKAYDEFRSYCDIRRWVRKKDGSLS